MNENNVMAQPETPAAPPAPAKSGGIPKAVWLVGCGCLALLVCAALIAVLAWFLLPRLMGGGDPISAVVPGNAVAYVNIDLIKAQSDQVNKIASALQQAAKTSKNETSLEMANRVMNDEYGMSFAADVLPWIGQYAGAVLTEVDFKSGNSKYMLIVETRDTAKADAFILKFTAAMETKKSTVFEKSEQGGVTLYTHTGSNIKDTIVIARNGNFVYLANTEDAITASAKLKSGDSLSGAQVYKDSIAALPADRIASAYIGADIYQKYIESMGSTLPSSTTLASSLAGLEGLGLSLSAKDVGLQMDMAIAYDKDKLSQFQKDNLAIKYKNPTVDKLLPDDTFLYLGMNSTQNFGKYLQKDSPAYTKDVQESLDLLEKQYGVSLQKLFGLLSGEFAIAAGPATDGMLPEVGKIKAGVTILASTSDESGFDSWFKDLLAGLSKNMKLTADTKDVTIGNYALRSLTIPQGLGYESPVLYYGADKGYIVLGTSKLGLEKGLGGKNTLAGNTTYTNTWKAFPSGSVPYMYVDIAKVVDFIKTGDNTSSVDTSGWEKMPVFAATINQASGYTQSYTLILFVMAVLVTSRR